MLKPLTATAIVATCAGCAHMSPRTQYGTAQDAYIAAVDTCLTLQASGRISDHDWIHVVNPAIQEGNQILNEWDAASKAGQSTVPLQAALSAVSATLRVIAAEAAAK